jgi:hypothetical protein
VSPRGPEGAVETGRHVSVATTELQAELATVTCCKSGGLSVFSLARQILKFLTVLV